MYKNSNAETIKPRVFKFKLSALFMLILTSLIYYACGEIFSALDNLYDTIYFTINNLEKLYEICM